MPHNQHSPRIRQLLRQAERVADLEKRLAARQLYEQILEEAPDTAVAWVGLGKLETDPENQIVAFEKALSHDPDHHEAATLLAELTGQEPPPPLEPAPEPSDESAPSDDEQQAKPEPTAQAQPPTPEAVPVASDKPIGQPRREKSQNGAREKQTPPKVVQARFDTAVSPPPATNGEALVCYRHPATETSLRCNRCSNPICIKCANRTSVGYRCPDCLYELEEKYYTGKQSDYFIALAVSAPLSLAIGFLLVLIGFSFWFIFLIFIAGGSIGTLIARLTFRAIGRRRSRYLAEMVAATVAIGALAPAVALFVLGLLVGSFNPFVLALPALYAFIATGSAYYQIR